MLQKEEYLLVQIRFAKLKSSIIKSGDRNKSDIERDNVALKVKLKFYNSKREHEVSGRNNMCCSKFLKKK